MLVTVEMIPPFSLRIPHIERVDISNSARCFLSARRINDLTEQILCLWKGKFLSHALEKGSKNDEKQHKRPLKIVLRRGFATHAQRYLDLD